VALGCIGGGSVSCIDGGGINDGGGTSGGIGPHWWWQH
jgi:hypothetical protein